MKFRSPIGFMAIGITATLVLALGVVLVLTESAKGGKAVSDNAAVIGALVALGGVFTAQMVSIALDDRRTQEARALEDRRTQEARDLEAQRAGETALQNYFEQVGKLLIEKPLRRASPGDDLSTVVRVQTLSVLEGLDPARKRILLLFLYESGLIHKDKPVVHLVAANLAEANLDETYMKNVYLFGANLGGAVLRGADLGDANLSRANLFKAALGEADLIGSNLSNALLSGANLRDANLRKAVVSGANLRDASLFGATLFRTDLSEANLLRADLSGANLRGAEGITNEELEQQAASLEGATMPNGQKYEDWLKSKDSKEDG